MQFMKEDETSTALDIDEPGVGKKYDDEYIQKRVDIIQKAIKKVRGQKMEDSAKEAIMADLNDKLDKWENVEKETKPAPPPAPPADGEEGEAPAGEEDAAAKEEEDAKADDEAAKEEEKDDVDAEKDDEEKAKKKEEEEDEKNKKREKNDKDREKASESRLMKRLIKTKITAKKKIKSRDYKKEYADFHGTPEQKINRALRNTARRQSILDVGDPREIDHIKPLSKGGDNDKSNRRIVSRTTNRKKGNTE